MDKFSLSERLRQARALRKFTQQNVADLLNISRSTYANYEAGNREPSIVILKKFASKLNISTEWLLGFSDNPEINREQEK